MSMPPLVPMPVPIIDRERLLAAYDGLLLDAYGVLLDRSGALPGAADLLQRLDTLGKPWLVVTNAASRPPEALAAEFAKVGLTIDPARILTSGDILAPTFDQLGLRGAACLLLGPASARGYVERAGGRLARADEEDAVAALIVADQDVRFPDDLDRALTLMLRRLDAGLPLALLLCNPDLLYPLAPGRFGCTAGALAAILEAVLDERYPQRALRFMRLGKPYPPIFTEARRRLGVARPAMLGDQLATDIRGALENGIDAVLVGTGLAPGGDPATWAPRPTWYLPSLCA